MKKTWLLITAAALVLLGIAAFVGRQSVPDAVIPAGLPTGTVTAPPPDAAASAPTAGTKGTGTTARTTQDLSPLPYAPGTGTGLKNIDRGDARAVLSGFSDRNRIPLPDTWMGQAVQAMAESAGEGYPDAFLTWAFSIPTVTEDGSLRYDYDNGVEPPYSRYWHSLAYTHARVCADFLCYARETYYVEGSTDLADSLNAVLPLLPEPAVRLAALEDGRICAVGTDGIWYDLTNGSTISEEPALSRVDVPALPAFDLREETPLWVSDYLTAGVPPA